MDRARGGNGTDARKRVLCDVCDDETLFPDSDWTDTVECQCDEC